jgi:hypothetical protein
VYAADVGRWGRWVRRGELGRESLGSEVANLKEMGHLFRERIKLESFVQGMLAAKRFAEITLMSSVYEKWCLMR